MRTLPVVFLFAWVGLPTGSRAAQLRELFKRVNGSGVEVRTVERTLSQLPQGGFVREPGLGSGSADFRRRQGPHRGARGPDQRSRGGAVRRRLGEPRSRRRIDPAGRSRPAPARAGGDIILVLGGIEVSADAASFDRIYADLTTLKPGDVVAVRVLRDGKIITLSGRARRL